MKAMNINIQGAQQTPSKMKLQTHIETHNQTLKRQRQRTKLESSKSYKFSNKIICRFLIRNCRGHRTVGQYIQSAQKYYQPRFLHPAKLFFKNEGKIKTFPENKS